MASWYYLISSLPELTLDDGFQKHPYPVFDAFAAEELDAGTHRAMRSCFLLNDAANAARLLNAEARRSKDRDESEGPAADLYLAPALYAEADWAEAMADADAVIPVFADFIWDTREGRRRYPDISMEDELIRRLMDSLGDPGDSACDTLPDGTPAVITGFPRDYLVFEMHLRNLSRAVMHRAADRPIDGIVVPFDDFSRRIAASPAPDFGLGGDLGFLAPLIDFRDSIEPLAFETAISSVRWQWLDDRVDYRLFSDEAVFAYAIKIADIQRWLELSPEKGRERLDALLEGLHDEIRTITREEIHP